MMNFATITVGAARLALLILALAVPANERMDALIEKATELGAASVQPLMMARSVVQLGGDRAAKRLAHWQAVAAAACEQSGRNRLPLVAPVQALSAWLAQRDRAHQGFVLSPQAQGPLTSLARAPGGASSQLPARLVLA